MVFVVIKMWLMFDDAELIVNLCIFIWCGIVCCSLFLYVVEPLVRWKAVVTVLVKSWGERWLTKCCLPCHFISDWLTETSSSMQTEPWPDYKVPTRILATDQDGMDTVSGNFLHFPFSVWQSQTICVWKPSGDNRPHDDRKRTSGVMNSWQCAKLVWKASCD